MGIEVNVGKKFKPLYEPCRYKVFYGGRGGGKSYAIRDYLILMSLHKKCRIGCFREIQNTIRDSSYKLIKDGIYQLGLENRFDITNNEIRSDIGSEFIFKGLRFNADEIKSTEGINYCWVEEAQNVSASSWDILIPTIRAEGSEIIISFNPNLESDATYQRFVVNPPQNANVIKVNWNDNKFLPTTLREEMEYCKERDYEAYLHIWEGNCVLHTDAQVFNGKFEAATFEPPENMREWYIGADWGFSQDPTAIVAMYIYEDCLWIRYEAGGIGIEFEELPPLFDSLGSDSRFNGLSRKYRIYADSARPETISYIQRKGYDIQGAKKWQGSVEDGISFMRSFKKIYIHTDCKRTLDEFRLYSYKVDRVTEQVTNKILDMNNHYIDACRYALDPFIRSKGSVDWEEAYKNWFDNENI